MVLWVLEIVCKTRVAGYYGSSAPAGFQSSQWETAHATFYGDETASETMGIFFIYKMLIII